jgi:putative transposase
MVRNVMKYVAWKDYKVVEADLKFICQWASEEEALQALEEFAQRWGGKYP